MIIECSLLPMNKMRTELRLYLCEKLVYLQLSEILINTEASFFKAMIDFGENSRERDVRCALGFHKPKLPSENENRRKCVEY
jgi:hypothetical protein